MLLVRFEIKTASHNECFLGEFICPKGVLTGPSASEPWGSPWSSVPVGGGGGGGSLVL